MTQCISRRRGSDLRPSIMRPVCFLQPARVRHVYCVSPYPPKPCQALPPPMGSPAAHWLVLYNKRQYATKRYRSKEENALSDCTQRLS